MQFLKRAVFTNDQCQPIAKRVLLSHIQRQPSNDLAGPWSAFDLRFMDVVIDVRKRRYQRIGAGGGELTPVIHSSGQDYGRFKVWMTKNTIKQPNSAKFLNGKPCKVACG